MFARRVFRALVALSFLAAAAPAQKQCQSVNDDGTFKDSSALGFPVSFAAFLGTAKAKQTVTFVEVFTGESSGTMSVSLWSHDATNNRPLAPLAGAGSWTMNRVDCWQGAAPAKPVVLTKGQKFWVVWQTTMFCQASFSGSASAVPVEYCYSDTGARWYQQSAGVNYKAPAKFRLSCPGPSGNATSYGTGKIGYGGLVPVLGICSNPAIGNRIDVICDRTAPAAPALLLVGTKASIATLYGTLYVQPMVLIPTLTRYIVTPAPASGYANVTLGIPDDSALRSVVASFQLWIFDTMAAQSFTHSNGVTVTIG